MENSSKKIKENILRENSGFTLVEMLVAVSVFVVVVFVAVGALLSITDANRKANSLRAVMDNMNFAMENMARSIRTGYEYKCDDSVAFPSCISGKSKFSFINQKGKKVIYKFAEENNLGKIMISKDGGPFLRITAPEIDIDKLTFYVVGALAGDSKQPLVVIVIKGSAGSNKIKTKSSFSIQTTISQRKIDS